MSSKNPQEPSDLGYYALPLVGGAAVGLVMGRVVDIGGFAGLLIGAFLVDAFRGLFGTQRLAAELRQASHDLLDIAKTKASDGQSSNPGGSSAESTQRGP
jgi:hypothetical protein